MRIKPYQAIEIFLICLADRDHFISGFYSVPFNKAYSRVTEHPVPILIEQSTFSNAVKSQYVITSILHDGIKCSVLPGMICSIYPCLKCSMRLVSPGYHIIIYDKEYIENICQKICQTNGKQMKYTGKTTVHCFCNVLS